ncbi:hypothetical protein EAI_09021 [Harpegnathos saltator]|uniref:Uncharacterized protein n=1 Tax=Harpegnathos saltator TaxID=610380 RepID=E2BFC0_HARSA|nr:hypothetical protein EAI_09021 [Harpegnathos saltator]
MPMKKSELIDKPIVLSSVTPNRIASPKRYMDTYITETCINSNDEKYIFEKEIHEDNGKVYRYEKKITNKTPTNGYLDGPKPWNDFTVEARTDKYGDKYIVETRTHEGCTNNFEPFLSERSRTSLDDRFHSSGSSLFRNNGSSPYKSLDYLVKERDFAAKTASQHFRSGSR